VSLEGRSVRFVCLTVRGSTWRVYRFGLGGQHEEQGGVIRSTDVRGGPLQSWMQVDVDGPREITGFAARSNRRLQDELWAELERVGATKDHGADNTVLVAGEVALGTLIRGLSSMFLVGVPDEQEGRCFIFTGTGRHNRQMWKGGPDRALSLLANVASGTAADGFWTVFAAALGFEQREAPGVEASQLEEPPKTRACIKGSCAACGTPTSSHRCEVCGELTQPLRA
jgi:hypothetical protein